MRSHVCALVAAALVGAPLSAQSQTVSDAEAAPPSFDFDGAAPTLDQNAARPTIDRDAVAPTQDRQAAPLTDDEAAQLPTYPHEVARLRQLGEGAAAPSGCGAWDWRSDARRWRWGPAPCGGVLSIATPAAS